MWIVLIIIIENHVVAIKLHIGNQNTISFVSELNHKGKKDGIPILFPLFSIISGSFHRLNMDKKEFPVRSGIRTHAREDCDLNAAP